MCYILGHKLSNFRKIVSDYDEGYGRIGKEVRPRNNAISSKQLANNSRITDTGEGPIVKINEGVSMGRGSDTMALRLLRISC